MIPVTFDCSDNEMKRLVHVVPRPGDRVILDDAPYEVSAIEHDVTYLVESRDISVSVGRGNRLEKRTMTSATPHHLIRIHLKGLLR